MNYKKLGEVWDILDNLRKPITKRDRQSGPYPYYGATGIQDHVAGYIYDEDLILVGEDGARWGAGESSAYKISGKSWVNNHAHVLRPHRDILLDDWLVYYLNISDLSGYITGTTVKKLNQAKLRSIEIPLPPIAEQKKIVARLEGLLGKIKEAKRLRAEAQEAAQNLLPAELHRIFTQQHSNILQNVGMSSKWEEKELGEIVDEIKSGFACGKQNEVANGIVHLRTHNIDTEGNLNFYKTTQIPKELVNENAFGLKVGDILFNNTNSTELVGKTALVRKDFPYAFSNHLTRIRVNKNVALPEWIVHVFNTFWRDKFFERICNRWVGQSGINQTTLKKFKIPLPPVAEQKKIVARLDSLSAKIRRLQEYQKSTVSDFISLEQSILSKSFQ